MNRKVLVALLVVGLVLLLSVTGCGGKKQTTTPTSPSTTPSTTSGNTVTMKNFAFNPQELTVSAGASVTFKNDDSVTHTVTGTGFDSGDIQPGGEFKRTFDTVGTFDYHCSIHPSMTGSIIVK